MNINLKIESKRNMSPSDLFNWISKANGNLTRLECHTHLLTFFEKHIAINYKVIKVSKKCKS